MSARRAGGAAALSLACTLAAPARAADGVEAASAATDYVRVDGGSFETVVPLAAEQKSVTLKPFLLQAEPVTNREFLAFVTRNPAWRRGAAPAVFADGAYLAHWRSPLALGDEALAAQPVVNVSWFAAEAYCEAEGSRLPSWHEWEYAAAADETRRDARADPAWRQRILDWYARPANEPLPAIGQGAANVHGARDLHGLVWEWVEDAGSLMISGDNREQGDPDLAKFCGTGALTMEQKENYAVLMRVAMLSSLSAAGTTKTLGFRCARDLPPEAPP